MSWSRLISRRRWSGLLRSRRRVSGVRLRCRAVFTRLLNVSSGSLSSRAAVLYWPCFVYMSSASCASTLDSAGVAMCRVLLCRPRGRMSDKEIPFRASVDQGRNLIGVRLALVTFFGTALFHYTGETDFHQAPDRPIFRHAAANVALLRVAPKRRAKPHALDFARPSVKFIPQQRTFFKAIQPPLVERIHRVMFLVN